MFASFEDYLLKVRPQVDDVFENQLSGLIGNDDGEWTYAILANLKGGKRIRGCLLCLICNALGSPLEPAIPRAVAIELIHCASLIHDDFVDQDTSRRGLPATWTLEGARRAVLLGDLIFASAIERMSALGREDGLVVAGAIANISKGAFHEETDPRKMAGKIRNGSFDGSIYERIIRLKTGILFGAACRLGGVAAGAENDVKESLFRYGLRIGEAYQVADDLKDVRNQIARGFIHPNEMTVIAPALFSFLKGARRLALVLERAYPQMDDKVMEYLKTAENLMENDIKRRLDSIASEIPPALSENGYGALLRRVPSDMIAIFEKTC